MSARRTEPHPTRPVWRFFLLAYAISWLCYLPFTVIARQHLGAELPPALSLLSAVGNLPHSS